MQGTVTRASPVIAAAFGGLDPRALAELQQACVRRAFARGQYVYRCGEPQRHLFIVRDGSVKLCFPGTDGSETIVGVMGPGDPLGGTGSFHPYDHHARAAESTSTFMLHLDQLFASSPELHDRAVLMAADRRLRATTRVLHETLSGNVRARVAFRLLELAHRHGARSPDGTQLQLRLTQEDLARMTGTSRESVNKVIAWFFRHGLLANAGGRYLIRDLDALEAAARG